MLKTITTLIGTILVVWASSAEAQPAATPPQLQQYINLAIQQNPDLMASRARWRQADARVGQANSNLWPRIDLNSTYTNFSGGRIISIPGLGTFSTAKLAVVPWDNNISATWNIFNYAVWEGEKATTAYLGAASSDVSAKELGIGYQVSEAYYAYAKAAELVGIRESAVQLVKQNLTSTQALFNADKALRNDVLRAEVAVASAEGDVLVAKNQQNIAKTNFNNLLKREYNADIDLPPAEALADAPKDGRSLAFNSDTGEPRETTTLEQDVEQAMRSRPELAELTQSQEATEGLRAVSYADNIPSLAIFAKYGWQEDKLRFSGNDDYLAAGVSLHWNLFTGFNTKSKVAENDAQIEEIEFQKESVANAIRIEIQNARLERENARDRRTIAVKQLASAQENQTITKAQYDLGVVPLITMIDAETTLANARANMTVTTYDVLTSEAKYRKALGVR